MKSVTASVNRVRVRCRDIDIDSVTVDRKVQVHAVHTYGSFTSCVAEITSL